MTDGLCSQLSWFIKILICWIHEKLIRTGRQSYHEEYLVEPDILLLRDAGNKKKTFLMSKLPY